MKIVSLFGGVMAFFLAYVSLTVGEGALVWCFGIMGASLIALSIILPKRMMGRMMEYRSKNPIPPI